jgi:hypothetical protein
MVLHRLAQGFGQALVLSIRHRFLHVLLKLLRIHWRLVALPMMMARQVRDLASGNAIAIADRLEDQRRLLIGVPGFFQLGFVKGRGGHGVPISSTKASFSTRFGLESLDFVIENTT